MGTMSGCESPRAPLTENLGMPPWHVTLGQTVVRTARASRGSSMQPRVTRRAVVSAVLRMMPPRVGDERSMVRDTMHSTSTRDGRRDRPCLHVPGNLLIASQLSLISCADHTPLSLSLNLPGDSMTL